MLAGMIMAVTFSIDALVTGFSYTLQQIRISFGARLLVGFITMLIFESTILLGTFCKALLPGEVLEVIGMLMLLIIGLEFIRTAMKKSGDNNFDWNHSKDINFREAIALAVSLSFDSASAGIAAVIAGLDMTFTGILAGLMQMLFLGLGIYLGKRATCIRVLNQKLCGVFSGILLILIACVRFCF